MVLLARLCSRRYIYFVWLKTTYSYSNRSICHTRSNREGKKNISSMMGCASSKIRSVSTSSGFSIPPEGVLPEKRYPSPVFANLRPSDINIYRLIDVSNSPPLTPPPIPSSLQPWRYKRIASLSQNTKMIPRVLPFPLGHMNSQNQKSGKGIKVNSGFTWTTSTSTGSRPGGCCEATAKVY